MGVVYFNQLLGAAQTQKLVKILLGAVFSFLLLFNLFLSEKKKKDAKKWFFGDSIIMNPVFKSPLYFKRIKLCCINNKISIIQLVKDDSYSVLVKKGAQLHS